MILVTLVSTSQTGATNQVDSIKQVALSGREDTTRVKALLKFSKIVLNNNPDTALHYMREALRLARKVNYTMGIASSYYSLGTYHYSQGQYDKALDYFLKGLKLYKQEGHKKGMAGIYNNIGGIHFSNSQFDKAINYYKKSLEIKKQAGDEKGMAYSYNNIGGIFYRKGDYDKALDYYWKSLRLKKKLGLKKGVSYSYNNIASLYTQLFVQDSIDSVTVGEGYVLPRTAWLDTARAYQRKAYKIQKEMDDLWGMVYTLKGLGWALLAEENYRDAITFYQKAATIADSLGTKKEIYDIHKRLTDCYDSLGLFQQALQHHRQYAKIKDSVHNQKSREKITEMEARYKDEKQKRKILQQQQELKQQKLLLYSAGGTLLLILVFSGLLYNRFRVTRQQKQIIEGQKDVVEEKNKQITDSITYAQRIQQAVLVPEKQIKKSLPQCFTLLKPKGIVSGDFYYFAEVRDNIIISAIDCTGHGVPGAFMSLIGNDLLNQIVHDQSITSPAEVLNELDNQLEQVLRQESDLKQELEMTDEDFVRDGMDLAFCVLHPAENVKSGKGKVTLQYAGANNPLYVVSGSTLKVKGSKPKAFQPKNLHPSNLQLYELPPDKQPIGKQTEKKPFTDKMVRLKKGDIFYIFSDGYPDQFGGPKGKKFMKKRFKELLLSICEMPMEKQKTVLEKTISDWMRENKEEQIDDICIMGVRIA